MARRWTKAEDAYLRRCYDDGVPLLELADVLDRSVDALVARRALLGIPARRAPLAWSEFEDRLLRSAVEARVPATALAGRLERSVEQIRARRRELGLGSPMARRYTPAEDALLRDQWATSVAVGELANRLGRSPDAVRVHADTLGLHRPARRRRWTAADDVIVRDGYADGLTCQRIADDVGGRTAGAVAARARKLGLTTYARRWTARDDDRLRRLATLRSAAEIAQALSRTPGAVRRRARTLGLANVSSPRAARARARWSTEEDALLRLHAGLNPGALALRLDRSDQAVMTRLRRLGLREGRRRSPHHPARTDGGFTAGERRLIERELPIATGRRLVALGHRLESSPPPSAHSSIKRAR
jgi:hypothetical protein